MNHLNIVNTIYELSSQNGSLKGKTVQDTKRYVSDMKGFFENEVVRSGMNQDTLIYEVQAIFPIPEKTKGGLFFGRTVIHPGKVGSEYFMTKGHFHRKSNRGEYYWCLAGEGMLILMNRERKTWAERMLPGSLHYIPGHTAHRTINISDKSLIFGACWPSDAGHDYQEIKEYGFSARMKEVDGKAELVSVDN